MERYLDNAPLWPRSKNIFVYQISHRKSLGQQFLQSRGCRGLEIMERCDTFRRMSKFDFKRANSKIKTARIRTRSIDNDLARCNAGVTLPCVDSERDSRDSERDVGVAEGDEGVTGSAGRAAVVALQGVSGLAIGSGGCNASAC